MNHWATYDILSLTMKLENNLGDVSISEIQMFSYLSCILSILNGCNSNEWGYCFIKNKYGSPYSDSLNSTFNLITDNDTLNLNKGYCKSNELSKKKFEVLSNLELYKQRETYIDVATKCIKFIPYNNVREALFSEPTLSIANKNDSRKLLLDEESASIHLLYSQFEKLHLALKDNYKNLVIPALVWMSYTTKKQIG